MNYRVAAKAILSWNVSILVLIIVVLSTGGEEIGCTVYEEHWRIDG